MNWKLHMIKKMGFSGITNNIELFSQKVCLGYTHDKNLTLYKLNGAIYLQPMVSSKLMITVIVQSTMIWISNIQFEKKSQTLNNQY